MKNLGSRFKINERLVYVRPDGVQYRLHAPPSRVVMSEEGFGMPPLNYITDRAPFQHGDSVRTFVLETRPMQVVVLYQFCSRSEYWNGRSELIDTLRPNRITDLDNPGKLLYYLGNGSKRQLDVFLEGGPVFPPRDDSAWREWSFTEALRFVAHDPIWYNPTQKSMAFTGATNATFPIEFPVAFTAFQMTAAVPYLGNWLEYPSFEITGPIEGLHIHNHTTDESITLGYNLPAGYSITISLHGRKTITQSDGQNLIGYLTPESSLTEWALVPDPIAPGGVNTLHIYGSGTTGATAATMRWYDRYLGV